MLMPTLRSRYFAPNTRLQQAANGGKLIAQGERSDGVAAIQAGLCDLGYKMPASTRPDGSLDGIFGKETLGELCKFQSSKYLKADGIAGPKTLGALDEALLGRQGSAPKIPPKPKPSPPKVLPPNVPVNIEDLNYKIGSVDPALARDPGAGAWDSRPLTFSAATQAAGIIAAINSGATDVYPGPNATKHMKHYFGNTGRDYTIDLEGMIRSTNRAKQAMVAEANQAFRFIQLLPPGTHRFTSKSAESSYNYQNETNDWFFAIGGYSYWGKGIATVTEAGGPRRYEVEFHYHFFDRYNWDGGKEVRLPNPLGDPIVITDEFMGEFHRQGLAREFDCYGKVTRRFSWTGEKNFPDEQDILRPGR